MSDNKSISAGIMTSALLASLSLAVQPANATFVEEKCYGIAKFGMNDCAANGHNCASKALENNSPNEWIYTPQGTCSKIVTVCAEQEKLSEAERSKILKRVCRRVAEQKNGVTGGVVK